MEQWKPDPFWDPIITQVLWGLAIVFVIILLYSFFNKPKSKKDSKEKEDH